MEKNKAIEILQNLLDIWVNQLTLEKEKLDEDFNITPSREGYSFSQIIENANDYMKKELYCSKAIAVLLKEKKFKFESDFGYAKDENRLREFIYDDGHSGWYDNPREWYKACTLGTIVEMFVNKGVLISIVPNYGSYHNVYFSANVYEFNAFKATHNVVESSDYPACLEKAIVWVLKNINFD